MSESKRVDRQTDPTAAFRRECQRLLAAKTPLVFVVTWEEERLQKLLRDLVDQVFSNPAPVLVWTCTEGVRDLTDGEMMDDVFVFFPHPALIEQADELLGRDGCLNFFAGPKDKDFKASINFYDVHYEGHHLAGTSGGTTEDMQMALDLMSEGKLNPAHMITHVGGLDSAVDTILDLPNIPGGKKLVYVDVSMPMTPIHEFDERAEQADEPLKSVYRELGRLVDHAGGLWNKEAEEFLLSCDEVQFSG